MSFWQPFKSWNSRRRRMPRVLPFVGTKSGDVRFEGQAVIAIDNVLNTECRSVRMRPAMPTPRYVSGGPAYALVAFEREGQGNITIHGADSDSTNVSYIFVTQNPEAWKVEVAQPGSEVEPYPWSAAKAKARRRVREFIQQLEDANS